MDPTLKVGLAVLSALLFSLWVGWLTDKRLSRRDAARAQPAVGTPRRVLGRPVSYEAIRTAPVGSVFRFNRSGSTILFRRVSDTHVKVLRGYPHCPGQEYPLEALRPRPRLELAYVLIQEPKP